LSKRWPVWLSIIAIVVLMMWDRDCGEYPKNCFKSDSLDGYAIRFKIMHNAVIPKNVELHHFYLGFMIVKNK